MSIMKINFARAIKSVVKILAGLILLITLILLAISIVSGRHEAATKKLLSQEITQLPIPAHCSEGDRRYQNGDVDAVSTWTVSYECGTTLEAASNYITSTLTTRGYKKNDPNHLDSLYQIDYSNQEFDVSYVLGSRSASDNNNLSGNAPVGLIILQLTRHIDY